MSQSFISPELEAPELEALQRAFDLQSRGCRVMGSPFSADVLDLMWDDVRRGGVFAELMAPFRGLDLDGHMKAATPLRPLGWAHWLALGGDAPELSALYPPTSMTADRAALAELLPKLARARFADVQDFLTSPPQTNEVRRTLCLLGGFTTIASETGLPLRCLEIGASAGLNLNWNRFHYRLGEQATWGDAEGPVRIDGEWNGPLPPLGPVEVVERAGCDISPVDIRDPAMARRLEAYVWADQRERVERLRGAMALARSGPLDLVQSDAADWVEAQVHPRPGVATVLYHSVMWQYMPRETQVRIEAHMDRVSKLATADAPVAWLSMEPSERFRAKMEVQLRLWPNGGQRRLALVHPHGAAVDWGEEA